MLRCILPLGRQHSWQHLPSPAKVVARSLASRSPVSLSTPTRINKAVGSVAASVMPRPKRKASGLGPIDSQQSSSNPDSPVTSLQALRRSGRNGAVLVDTKQPTGKGVGIRDGDGDAENKDDMTSESDGRMKDKNPSITKGVDEAIHALAKMERRFKRAVKKQKLQLEESAVLVEGDSVGQQAFKPELTQISTGVLAASDLDKARSIQNQEMTEDCEAQKDDTTGNEVEGLIEPGEGLDAPERGASRAPPVNSDYLPLPWKGRLGYACLNTYLRNAKPPVFCSRTCRMASIIEHRHPLQDPTQPEHPTKNRPDKTKPADIARGQKYVQEIGLANARDLVKMIRWNDKYGIKFMRLSSEMFPFASHDEHGYKLAPFASEVLAEAGKVAAELGHRLTTHPGQFTQLGSPRKEVITAAVRDLEYHDEMLSLLKLPPQQDRDAVMILHMGGTYGDKKATLDRFRENYTNLLSESVKRRLVLENDDVAWSVHDLLPICEELNIPLVLDYHHHNIIFDADKCREGTFDISQPEIMERISATWRRKGIKQKMHYSEPCAGATTPRDRRKHSARVMTLPPCPPDADLMIEAKDKEQAVFELMKNFKLPGYEKINDVVPFERLDENRPPPPEKKAKTPRKKGKNADIKEEAKDSGADNADSQGNGLDTPKEQAQVSAENFAMGGPSSRVYWPIGMEDWLRPKKREKKMAVEADK